MSDITFGDTVQFSHRNKVRPYLHTLTGYVTSLNDVNATVLVGYALHVVPLGELVKVDAETVALLNEAGAIE